MGEGQHITLICSKHSTFRLTILLARMKVQYSRCYVHMHAHSTWGLDGKQIIDAWCYIWYQNSPLMYVHTRVIVPRWGHTYGHCTKGSFWISTCHVFGVLRVLNP